MRTSKVKAKSPKSKSAIRKASLSKSAASDSAKTTAVILELRLYVAGQTPKSLVALKNLEKDLRRSSSRTATGCT